MEKPELTETEILINALNESITLSKKLSIAEKKAMEWFFLINGKKRIKSGWFLGHVYKTLSDTNFQDKFIPILERVITQLKDREAFEILKKIQIFIEIAETQKSLRYNDFFNKISIRKAVNPGQVNRS
jgi:hypothetical protein